MKKMIIPRKDHEVYFFTLPINVKKKHFKNYVYEQLDKLHPFFLAYSSIDIKILKFNKNKWIMATVMKTETLTEYKIINRNTVFYTNTSIEVSKKDFIKKGINKINDEKIGFDPNTNEPVSIPLESDEKSNDSPVELNKITIKHAVYNKKAVKWYFIPCFAALIVLFFISSTFFSTETNKIISESETETIIFEPLPEKKQMPSSIEILSIFSEDIVREDGKILSWKYNEDFDSFIVVQISDVEILNTYEISNLYEFLYLYTIQDIRYNDGKPTFTVFLNAEKDYYRSVLNSFPDQSIILPLFADFKNKLLEQDIYLISEILPNSPNNLYTITFTAKDWNLVSSLEIINEFCMNFPFTVKSMDITINSDNNRFTVVSSFSYGNELNQLFSNFSADISKIPIAFGYRENTPAPIIRPVTVDFTEPDLAILGSIRDSNGQLTFYRDIDDGKIRIRGDL